MRRLAASTSARAAEAADRAGHGDGNGQTRGSIALSAPSSSSLASPPIPHARLLLVCATSDAQQALFGPLTASAPLVQLRLQRRHQSEQREGETGGADRTQRQWLDGWLAERVRAG